MNPLLAQEGRGDLRLMDTGIVMQKKGPLGAHGWALLMDFSDNFREHNLGIVGGSDCWFLRQNVNCYKALHVE